jgi:hypothetical protein
MTELFANFEVNREPRWQLVLGLLGGSAVLHLALAAAVVYVPAFRDALNIAALAGRAGYVDRPYTKTIIGDEVRMVEVGGKFQYPPGYFAPAGALAQLLPGTPVAPDPLAPKIVSQAGSIKPENTPSPNASPSPLPSASPAVSPAPSPSGSPLVADSKDKPKEPSEIDQKLDQIAKDNNVLRPDADEINTRPLKDWLKKANDKKEKGELDLTKVVEIKIEAQLNKDCRLTDAAVVQKSGDERLTDTSKELAAAISDSNMLSFLKDPEKHKDENPIPCEAGPLSLTVKLDEGDVTAQVESQADSPERATQLARAYNGLLFVGQMAKQGKDEEVLYKHTKVLADGKQIVVRFRMPRQTAGEMLTKQLKPAG